MSEAVVTTNLPLPNKRTGKVRDLYDLVLPDGSAGVLIIATDRVSVFDVVLANGIPGKGILLTQISKFWFEFFADEFVHHLVSTDPADIPGITDDQQRLLAGRIMICRKSAVVPVECVVRGYLTGSGYKDYQRTGEVCGIELQDGLINSDRLTEAIFTPSTKADEGHDENISYDLACKLVGAELMDQIRENSMSIYEQGEGYALERGIIIPDTKFEI